MQQHLNIVTILVKDLHRALAFYRDGLGWQPWWPTTETTDEIDHAAFQLGHGLSLVLYPGAKAWLEHRIQLNLVADRHPDGVGGG